MNEISKCIKVVLMLIFILILAVLVSLRIKPSMWGGVKKSKLANALNCQSVLSDHNLLIEEWQRKKATKELPSWEELAQFLDVNIKDMPIKCNSTGALYVITEQGVVCTSYEIGHSVKDIGKNSRHWILHEEEKNAVQKETELSK